MARPWPAPCPTTGPRSRHSLRGSAVWAPSPTTTAPAGGGFGQVQIPQGYFSGGGAGADYGGNAFLYPARDSYGVAANSVFTPQSTSVYGGYNPFAAQPTRYY